MIKIIQGMDGCGEVTAYMRWNPQPIPIGIVEKRSCRVNLGV
ncbi:MAG: hypothetical protein QXL25_01250 [Candidatus Bathyarchaeia archaeon]